MKKGDDTMKILKRAKIWIAYKALRIFRDAIEESFYDELEETLDETLVEFYERRDIDGKERELIDQFVDYAKGELVPRLLRRLHGRFLDDRLEETQKIELNLKEER